LRSQRAQTPSSNLDEGAGFLSNLYKSAGLLQTESTMVSTQKSFGSEQIPRAEVYLRLIVKHKLIIRDSHLEFACQPNAVARISLVDGRKCVRRVCWLGFRPL
jgi:hypothetical protein